MAKPMITFFSAPKPFTNPHINTIQRNAIQSWIRLGDKVQVLLLGDDEGVDRVASEFKVPHLSQVRCNEKGTPLISSMLELAREHSNSPFLCIINTDILVMPDMLDGLEKVANLYKRFLLVGQRWDLEVNESLQTTEDLFGHVGELIRRYGRLHPPMGSDYFIFPRTCFTHIPDFAIGRAGWDNWMIFKARLEGWIVVDGSQDITIAHQDHDYSHLSGGLPHYRQPETAANVKLAGGDHTIFTLHDAQAKLVDGSIQKIPLTWKRFWRQIEIFPITFFKSKTLSQISYFLFHPRKTYLAFRRLVHESLHRNDK
ncbi:MAG: hypothetical protein GYA18_02840 [Chloroflexi bacterium]|nr:hypothetical protein [Chloroflexota bacterium]